MDALSRFWSRVDASGECWVWTGARAKNGYGHIQFRAKVSAHRFSWELHSSAQVPDGLLVLHRCDNRLCVRPDHLFLGTAQDNSIDMYEKGRGIRPARMLTVGARTAHLSEWSRESGISKALILYRLRIGWSPEKVLTIKPRPYRRADL